MRQKTTHFFIYLGILLSAVTVSCHQDGENPYVLWDKFTERYSAFSFYYMSPPFIRDFEDIDNDFDMFPKLYVDPYDQPTEGGLDARIRVEAQRCEDGHNDLEELNARIKYWQGINDYRERYLTYVNYFGDVGKMLQLEWQDHWVKEIYYNENETCVRIFAWTNERGSLEDIEFLLASFRPGGGEIDD